VAKGEDGTDPVGEFVENSGSIVTLGLVEACASIEREQIIRQHFDDDAD
jgi:hypothetical protein